MNALDNKSAADTDPRTQPSHFSDPAQACLFEMVMTLAEEVAVVREQLDAVLAINESGGKATRQALDHYQPNELAAQMLEESRAAFSERLLAPLQALMQSMAKTT